MAVIPVAPKINSLFNKNGNDKPFKILSFIYKMYHVAFGLDLGFVKFKSFTIKRLFNLFSFVKSLIFCYVCAHNAFNLDNLQIFFWFTIFLLHYLTYVVLLLFFDSDTSFCNLLQDLQIIDLGLKVDKSSYNLELKIVVAICTSLLYRVTVQCAYCIATNNCLLPTWIIALFAFLISCADLVHITFTFVFYSVNCRLKKLISILKIPDSDIMFLLHIYKSLVDIVEMNKAAFDMVFLASLIFYIPNAMVTIYFSVSAVMRRRTIVEVLYISICHYTYLSFLTLYCKLSMDLFLDYAEVIAASVLTLFPALSAGALTSQGIKLILVLHDKILQQQDIDVVLDVTEEYRIREIERFIGYVETRGCRFCVCQVIPLDADLLGMVVSFCITYLIVIIQFTDFKGVNTHLPSNLTFYE